MAVTAKIETRILKRSVYEVIMPDGCISPADAVAILDRATYFGDNEREALHVFIDFSVKHGRWVGVTLRRLKEEVKYKHKGRLERMLLITTLKAVVDAGYLQEPFREKRWWLFWINWFFGREFYPSEKLLARLKLVQQAS